MNALSFSYGFVEVRSQRRRHGKKNRVGNGRIHPARTPALTLVVCVWRGLPLPHLTQRAAQFFGTKCDDPPRPRPD